MPRKKSTKGYHKIPYKKPKLTTTERFKRTMNRKIKRLELKVEQLEKASIRR